MLIEVVLQALGVPMVLFGLLLLLARFEAWVVEPGERAARVVELLDSAEEPDEVEREAARILQVVVPVTEAHQRPE